VHQRETQSNEMSKSHITSVKHKNDTRWCALTTDAPVHHHEVQPCRISKNVFWWITLF